ncbi:MAG: O-methyltransferase [Cyclobacteriaceae bacterium]
MEFIAPELSKYIENHTTDDNDLLKKIDRDTHANILKPRMLSGKVQGRVLSLISKLLQPNSILEIGTYTGYSALCLAEGLTPSGKLITLDINEELEQQTRTYFDQSNYSDRIDYRIANAMEEIPNLSESFDLIFIDADKKNYLNYYHLVIDKLNPGGVLIADNILWSGKVIEEVKKNDKDTPILIEFNKTVHEDERVENILLGIRDGLMVVRKK